MSHDRGCSCGKEPYEYRDCKDIYCSRSPLFDEVAFAARRAEKLGPKPAPQQPDAPKPDEVTKRQFKLILELAEVLDMEVSSPQEVIWAARRIEDLMKQLGTLFRGCNSTY